MPIVSNRIFSQDGYLYNITEVLDSNLRLNETAYQEYGRIIDNTLIIDFDKKYFLGPIRMTPIFAFSYGISFAAIAAVIVHTVLYQGKDRVFL